jgi:signal transduction histidine kinase
MVVIAFGTTGFAQLLTGGVAPELNTMVYFLLLPYALFRWGSGREAALGAVIMLTRVALSTLSASFDLADAVGGFAVLTSTMALGAVFRYRASTRERELDQVKLMERERLARDLHDTVAHHVSAIAIRAQAGLATSALHPNAATEALQLIEAEASRTLAEMRSMVRILRHDQPAELAPTPGITDLQQLADRSSAGPIVDVQLVGDQADLPPSVAAAIYRLAQEAVTNARRHARNATRIEVRVDTDAALVHLRVSDDGDTNPDRPAEASGYGLIGMIERVNLLGGSCQAGPAPDGGWTVTAVLPRTGWAA